MVTNKWQKFTSFAVTKDNLERLAGYCDEFLVHGVDAEVRHIGVVVGGVGGVVDVIVIVVDVVAVVLLVGLKPVLRGTVCHHRSISLSTPPPLPPYHAGWNCRYIQGKMCGVLEDLVSLLGDFSPRLVTYAGGASSLKDLDRVSIDFGHCSTPERIETPLEGPTHMPAGSIKILVFSSPVNCAD